MHSNNQQPPTSSNSFRHNVGLTETVVDDGYTPKQIMLGGIILMVALTVSLVFGTTTFGFGGDHSEQLPDQPAALETPAVTSQQEMGVVAPVGGAGSGASNSQTPSVSNKSNTSIRYESRTVTSSDPSENVQTSRLVVDGVEQPVSSSSNGSVNQVIQKTENNGSVSVQIQTSTSSTSSGGQSGGGN